MTGTSSALEKFSAEDAGLLAGLPYRVGIWMSETDDDIGEYDDESEYAALEKIITEIAKLHDDTPFVQEVCAQTLASRAKWPDWADDSLKILPDCRKAVALVKEQVSLQSAKNFRAALMEIASTVAQASGEFEDFHEVDHTETILGGIVSRIVGGISKLSHKDESHPVNISPAEDSALSRLSAALRVEE